MPSPFFQPFRVNRPRKRTWKNANSPNPRDLAQHVCGDGLALDAAWDDSCDDKIDKVVTEIEEHLLKLFRQERATVVGIPGAHKPPASAVQPSFTATAAAFKLLLFRDYFMIDGLDFVLPYSTDNQRFLQMIEAGRLPWDQLRGIPEVYKRCEGHYINGALRVIVEDRRLPEHCAELGVGAHERTLSVSMDDDALLMDLKDMEMDALLEGGDWNREFRLRLEALLLGAISPPPCLHPSLAVGRVCNMLQYDRLKLSHRTMRNLPADFVVLPVRKARFGAAAYGSWLALHHHHAAAAPALDAPHKVPHSIGSLPQQGGGAPPEGQSKRPRRPKVPGSMPSGAAQLKRDDERGPPPVEVLGAVHGHHGYASTGAEALHMSAEGYHAKRDVLPVPKPSHGLGKGNDSKVGPTGLGSLGGVKSLGSRVGDAGATQGEETGGIIDGQGGGRPAAAQAFALLKRLAQRSLQMQAQLLLQLPDGAAVFNKLAVFALRSDHSIRPGNTRDICSANGDWPHLMPEDLIPAHTLPPHGCNDPLCLPRTLSVREVYPHARGGGDGGASASASGGGVGVSASSPRREIAGVSYGEVQHELRLGTSDATGRHMLHLTIVEPNDLERSNDEHGAAAFTFHAQDVSFAHSLMSQWERVHAHEQRSRERKVSGQRDQQAAAAGFVGTAPPPPQHRGSNYAAAVAAAASAAAAVAAPPPRAPPSRSGGTAVPSQPPPMAPMPLVQRGSSANGPTLPRPIQACELGSLMPGVEDFPSPGGLSSPMSLSSSGGGGGLAGLSSGRFPHNSQPQMN